LGGWLATGVAPLMSSTPCRRMRLRLAIRDQFTPRAMTHFLATCMSRARSQQSRRAMSKTGGSALAPQRFAASRPSSGLSNRSANRERHTPPVRRGNHTPALSGLAVAGLAQLSGLCCSVATRYGCPLCAISGHPEIVAFCRCQNADELLHLD
jgi:hypothetical protein